jgi:2-hydroxychromene-2-carboxylate isomerase
MGQVIYLSDRRRARPTSPRIRHERPLFFFDVACPLSYLVAERVERRLGPVEWVAASRSALCQTELRSAAVEPALGAGEELALREAAEAGARELRLPLVWPDRFPSGAPCAQRAAHFACEVGAGGEFALAASRLAFCGGFDLEDPETLAEAAAAAGVPLEECLAAAGEAWRDEELVRAARELTGHGIHDLPAIRVGDRWFHGEAGLLAAEATLTAAEAQRAPLAPV